jgi:hypothetical protein
MYALIIVICLGSNMTNLTIAPFVDFKMERSRKKEDSIESVVAFSIGT